MSIANWALGFLLFVPLMAGAQGEPRGLDARDLVVLERVSSPSYSPNGKLISYLLRQTDPTSYKSTTSLWIMQPDGSAKRRISAEGMSVASPTWANDSDAIFVLSAVSGVMQLHRIDTTTGSAEQISKYPLDIGSYKLAPAQNAVALSFEVFPTCADLACTSTKLAELESDGISGQTYDRLFIRHWDTWKDGRRNQLFYSVFDSGRKLSGEPARLSGAIDGDVPGKPFGDEADYAFAPDGKSVVFSVRIAGNSESWSTNFDLYQVDISGESAPKNLTSSNEGGDFGPVFSADGKTLYYRAMKRAGFEADRVALMSLNLKSGARSEIGAQWDRSYDSIQFSKDGTTAYFSTLDTGTHPLFAITLADGNVRKLVTGGNVSSFSLSGNQIVFQRDSLAGPAQLYTVNNDGSAVSVITQFNQAQMDGVSLGEFEQFSFKGWDDETVYGYVIKPANYVEGKKYPVAFLIHGGPQGSFHNQWHYRWNAQTYAGAGFAVVMIDFHGSSGYGQDFTDSISGHWGDRPLEDLQKGWAFAAEKYAYLDAENACALGGSYGGFMVNWIAGVWNEPWKCLVSHAGVFDNRMMGLATEELWFTEWEFGGPVYLNPEGYERFNPINHVVNWNVPMLVIHGQKDYRVLVEQGIATFTALQRKGIESQFLYYPDENHWILKPKNSIQWHDTVNAWLKAHTQEQ